MKRAFALVVLAAVSTGMSEVISVNVPTGEVRQVIRCAALPRPVPFTIAFRFKATPYVYDRKQIGKDGLVFVSGNGWNHGFRVTILPEMDNALNGYRMSATFTCEDGKKHVGLRVPGIIITGRQYAIAFVWDGKEVRSYLNGTLASRTALSGYRAPQNPFAIGPAGFGVGYHPFSVENFTIWEQVLSDDQILAITTGLSGNGADGAVALPTGMIDPKDVAKYLAGLDMAAFSDMRTLAWNTARKLVDAGNRKEAADLYRLLAERAPTNRDSDGGNVTAARFAALYGATNVVPAVAGLATTPPVNRGGPTIREGAIDGAHAIYVAVSGDDEKGTGAQEHPFATLARALVAARGQEGARQIVLRGGRYDVQTKTVLGDADSGTEESPLLITAAEGEKVVFDGGREITGFAPCGRGAILCADVSTAGVDLAAPLCWGYALGIKESFLAELSEDDQALPLARHPNRGFFLTQDCDVSNRTFRLNMPDAAKWSAEPELMALSYLRWYWGDETTRLTVNPTNGIWQVTHDHIKTVKPGHPVRLMNALAALDEPGEWFLDHGAAKLYYWPRRPGARIELSESKSPFLQLENVTNVIIRGITFRATRTTAICMTGVRNILFRKNRILNCGAAMSIRGKDIEIADNEMRSFSFGAVSVSGGNRKTLSPAGIRILRNDISDVERRQRTYCPCVYAGGCGIEISGNHMHDAPSSAMRVDGNDLLITSNLVERCVLESDDQGAIDIYANPTYAGIEIIGNTWRDIGSTNCVGYVGQAAVRFDDVISGVRVYKNRFYNCGYKYFGAVQINGGRLNEVDDNLFVNCRQDVTINIRRHDWWQKMMTTGHYGKCISAVKPDEEPYRSRYPYMREILSWPCLNFVSRSTLINTPRSCRAPGENGNVERRN